MTNIYKHFSCYFCVRRVSSLINTFFAVALCVVANKVRLARFAPPKWNSAHLNNPTFVCAFGVSVSRENIQITKPPEHNSKGMLLRRLPGRGKSVTIPNDWTEIQLDNLHP